MSASNTDSSWTIPEVGDLVAGKYRVLRTLGQGGLAVVLAAMHERLEERVALKLLLPEWKTNDDVMARFLREGRACIKIHSEHVVRVFDVGETDDGAPYIVMEYLDGNDLANVIALNGALPIATAVDHIAQACEAIAEAHALSIIHRDLKPANLFLTARADGSACVKVLDFGISKVRGRKSATPLTNTNPRMIMGSPHYMSPEQIQSTRDADERSDVWALGACLHELLSGQPPFQGDTAPELCSHVMMDDPAPLSTIRSDVPRGLEACVLMALEKDPAHRYASVADFATAIASFGTPIARACADHATRVLVLAGMEPAQATPSTPASRASRPRMRSVARTRAAGAWVKSGLVMAIVAALAVGGVRLTRSSPTDARAATAPATPAAPSTTSTAQAPTTPNVATSSPQVPTAGVASPAAPSSATARVASSATAAPPAGLATSARRGAFQIPGAPVALRPTAPTPPQPTTDNETLFDERK